MDLSNLPERAASRDFSDAYAHQFAEFVKSAPTALYAAKVVADTLVSAGFVLLDEAAAWPKQPGKYVVVREGAVIAWIVPQKASSAAPWRVVGSHTDSPALRLKTAHSEFVSHGWQQESVEVYGGPILASWFDRDLEFAGRLVLNDGSEVLARTGAVARVPNLAIHLYRDDTFKPDREVHMQPILGAGDEPIGIVDLLAERAGAKASDVVSHDVFSVDSQAPARLGAHRELLASGRMDNLVSVFASLTAMLSLAESAPDFDHIVAMVAFDHEEVGSGSPSGAGGSLLEDVQVRVSAQLAADVEDRLRSKAGSWLISMDVGHVVHPNYASKHDARITPVPGGGVLLKVNANQRYATSGKGEAVIAAAAAAAGVKVQPFVSNNDVPCGTTIGPIVATRLGIPTVDIGAGVLSMHSARELIHVDDLAGLSLLAEAALTGEA